MELHPDLLGPGRLQEADRPVAVKGDLGVRGIVKDNQVVLPGEPDRLFEEAEVGYGAGRVVGVV